MSGYGTRSGRQAVTVNTEEHWLMARDSLQAVMNSMCKNMSKAQKIDMLRSLEKELDKGPVRDRSLGEVYQVYMDNGSRRWAASTIAAYTKYYNKHIGPKLGKRSIRDITSKELQAMMEDMSGYSTTCEGTYTVLRGIFDRAVSMGELQRNPMDDVSMPEHKEQRARDAMDDRTIEAFIRAAEGSFLHCFFILALRLGPRSGELRGLRWRDVDLDSRTLYIRHSLSDIRIPDGDESRRLLGRPKSKAGMRALPIPDEAMPLLTNMRDEWVTAHPGADISRLNIDDTRDLSDLVFRSRRSCALFNGSVNREIHRICGLLKERGDDGLLKDIEPVRVSCHWLRHSFASSAVRHEMSPKLLQLTMGHESYATTMNVYTHMSSADRRRELNSFYDKVRGIRP